ncbi:hypothetical protein Taro_021270, partial [Colocasia esculenta]|nr:hypothetical protein [Colocasia esculenta]
MAMPSGNSVIPDKMQFPSGGEVHHPSRQWLPDERDGFIFWLKGEFAAANAIIDSLCQHLRTTSEPGEYDMVFGCIQQRRCNWTPVLYMQQYFSIAEVNFALHQVGWRKQQRHFDQPKAAEKELKKPAFAYRQTHRFENAKESHNSLAQPMGLDAKAEKMEETPERREEVKRKAEGQVPDGKVSTVMLEKEGPGDVSSSKAECSQKDGKGSVAAACNKLSSVAIDDHTALHSKGHRKDAIPNSGTVADLVPKQEDKQKSLPLPRVFECNELSNGKMINVVDGLKLYEDLLEGLEISRLVSAANEWRTAGQKGELQGKLT